MEENPRPLLKSARTGFITAAPLAGQSNDAVSSSTAGEEGGEIRGFGGKGEGVLGKRKDKASVSLELSFSRWAVRVTKWAFGDVMVLPKR